MLMRVTLCGCRRFAVPPTLLTPGPPHPAPLPRWRPLQNHRHSGTSTSFRRKPESTSPFEAKGDASERSEIAGVCGRGRGARWIHPIAPFCNGLPVGREEPITHPPSV